MDAPRSKNAPAAGPRIISLKQPWAWAVSIGRKRVENRSWSTHYRGTIYIHASTKVDADAVQRLTREFRLTAPEKFVHGAVVAVAELVDVVTKSGSGRFGKWFFGPYGFVLSNIRPLAQPVRTTGKLGLSRAPRSLQIRVNRALKLRVEVTGSHRRQPWR